MSIVDYLNEESKKEVKENVEFGIVH